MFMADVIRRTVLRIAVSAISCRTVLYTQRRQMATFEAPKLLVLTDKTKLTLTVTLTLTDTVTVIFFARISSTPLKRLYCNNKIFAEAR